MIKQIQSTGPMPLSQFMAACLLDPEDGYYTQKIPFGKQGDFTTAPEISQMFGELIGLCIAQAWVDQGRPDRFILAEIGPGRGTLMADILRATQLVPGFQAAAEICLVEASPRLQEIQRTTLNGETVAWYRSIEDLPEGPLFLVANEFLDALPVDQYERGETGWRRREIGLQDDKLIFGLGAEIEFLPLKKRLGDTSKGDIVEFCPGAAQVAGAIADRLAKGPGMALFLDYGDWRSKGDTFQALANHKPANPLSDPGQADLTAHVDFEPFATALSANPDCKVTRMTPQGVFLERLGITQRAQALASKLAGSDLESHIAAHRRLTHPEEMGTLFKAIAAFPSHAPTPAGFEL